MALSYSTGLVQAVLGTDMGKGFGEAFSSGFVVDIYAGTRPANSDSATSGQPKLGTVTKNGVAVSTDSAACGLHFGEAASRALNKAAAETWQFTAGTAAGGQVASWFRLRLVPDPGTAASITDYRIDGSIGVSTGDALMSNTTMAAGNIYTLNQFRISWPL